MEKGEIAHLSNFTFFPQCFPKTFFLQCVKTSIYGGQAERIPVHKQVQLNLYRAVFSSVRYFNSSLTDGDARSFCGQ